MKKLHIIIIVAVILIADQALKYYIKTQYLLGEEHMVLGNWFRLHFVENDGMAWGWKLGDSGSWGKILLTVFRLVAVIVGVFYINKIVKEKQHPGFLVCAALIFAGAVGNLIDSLFYGMLFSSSDNGTLAVLMPEGGGYAGFLHGKVVDMFYFPIINSTWPSWMPFWGGEPFEFFSPVFNIADASISTGLIIILLFQKRFFKTEPAAAANPTVETNVPAGDDVQIS
ncbi:MAG: lipoprotein signal peptidase [Bacteroidetes bacterium]|nr:MAG: lipoprotein signal peptidase [Bacteroidota bacterium]